MKYFFCRLTAPRPTFATDMTEAEAQLMKEHTAYLKGFSDRRQAIVFGPAVGPQGAYGLAIFELPDDADINAICTGDPVIKSARGFSYEIHPMPRAVVRV